MPALLPPLSRAPDSFAQVCDVVVAVPDHEHQRGAHKLFPNLKAELLLCSLAAGTGVAVPVAYPHHLSLYPHHHRGHSQELHTPKPQRQTTVPPIMASLSSLVSPQLSSCLVQHSSHSTGIQTGTTPSAHLETHVPRQIRAAAGTSLHSLTHPHQKLGSSWDMRGSCRLCRG